MTTKAMQATKHLEWDKVGQNFFVAHVVPCEECEGQVDPVTITVALERGGKAGGWWIYTSDSTRPAHANSFAAAMRKAERIRKAREAEMDKATCH